MKVTYLKCRPTLKFPILAWLIMIFQGQNPFNKKSSSHRAVQFGPNSIIDCTGGKGVKVNTECNFLDKYTIVDTIDFNLDSTQSDLWHWVETIENKPYDYLDIFGDLLRRMFNFFSFKKIGKNWDRLTCNEVALSFAKRFYNVCIGDPDVWDLILTDKLMKEISEGNYGPCNAIGS